MIFKIYYAFNVQQYRRCITELILFFEYISDIVITKKLLRKIK